MHTSLPLLAQAGKDSKVFSVLIVIAMVIPSQSPYKDAIPEFWALKKICNRNLYLRSVLEGVLA